MSNTEALICSCLEFIIGSYLEDIFSCYLAAAFEGRRSRTSDVSCRPGPCPLLTYLNSDLKTICLFSILYALSPSNYIFDGTD